MKFNLAESLDEKSEIQFGGIFLLLFFFFLFFLNELEGIFFRDFFDTLEIPS